MLKAAIKHAAGEDQVRQRSVPAEVTQKYMDKLEGLKDEIKEVMQEEKEEKQVLATPSCTYRIAGLINILTASPSRNGAEER